MADESGAPTALTVSDLATVLQAMDEKYRLLVDAIIKKGESSRSEVENKEEVHPLQMPHVRLEGSESYASWAEHAETILVSRKLEGYVLGTVERPIEEESKEGQRWKMKNALVRAWLLSSISPQIAKQVERIKEASEIWRLLKGTFSGIGNEMLACKIQKELQGLSQGEKTVVEYVSELKRMWSDIDYYDPIELECGKCVEVYNKWTEKRRVRDFLNGLNPKFENRRAALYGSGKLPSLEEVISAIISEETRLKLEGSATTTHGITQGRSALMVADNTNFQRLRANINDRTCYECGQSGHLKAACPQLLRGGRGISQEWRGRGRGRFPTTRGSGRGRGMQPPGRAHATTVGEEAPKIVNIEMTADELQKWRQFKGLSGGDMQPEETLATSSSTSFSGNDSYTLGRNHIFAADAQWLIDSGASRHMAGSNRDFYKYASELKRENVKLADGSTQEVVGSGMVKCSPNMSLSSVLHVPAFLINLLSISCITKELNCTATFYPTWCIFQELGTRRNLGMGSMRDGLYYLDNNISSAAATKVSSSPLDEFLLHHRRMGHLSFAVLSQLYPNLYCKISKEQLVCDACQYGKQPRSSYLSSDNRSSVPLQTIHSDVWGPSRVVSLYRYRYFVTFIDCCTRTTWVYVLQHKNDVFECFKDFHNLIRTQYSAHVKVLRTDNGTEYVNN
jgi:hypothetical protein